MSVPFGLVRRVPLFPAPPPPVFHSSLPFSGAGEYVYRDSTLNPGTFVPTYFTIMGWVYGTSFPDFSSFASLSQGGSFYTIGSDARFFIFNDGATSIGSVLSVNTWYHFAMTLDGSSGTLRGFLDGREDPASLPAEPGITAFDKTWYGNSPGNDEWNGRICDAREFNYPMSAGEIRREMMSAVPVERQRLNAWYPLRGINFMSLENWSGLPRRTLTPIGTFTPPDSGNQRPWAWPTRMNLIVPKSPDVMRRWLLMR